MESVLPPAVEVLRRHRVRIHSSQQYLFTLTPIPTPIFDHERFQDDTHNKDAEIIKPQVLGVDAWATSTR